VRHASPAAAAAAVVLFAPSLPTVPSTRLADLRGEGEALTLSPIAVACVLIINRGSNTKRLQSCGRLTGMAKSKNHTSHNQSNKAHKNGIKRTLRQKHQSCRGMDPKFVRNQRCFPASHLYVFIA
jgi:hypothetical protein